MRVVSDISYGRLVDAVDPSVRIRGSRSALLTTFAMCARSFRSDAILTNEGTRTPWGLVILAAFLAVTRQRKLVLTEFLPGTRTGAKGIVVTTAYRALLRRTVLGVQVMTQWEADDYVQRYRLPADRVHHIGFYYRDDRKVGLKVVEIVDRPQIVMASGRNSCDWETITAAAASIAAPVEIICAGPEHERVSKLVRSSNVRVRCDIARDEHDALFASARAFLLALKDEPKSAGHVRLMSAATFGTPIIASDVRSIEGYAQLAAHLVPAKDAAALAAATNLVLLNEDASAARQDEIARLAAPRPFSMYAEEIRSFVEAAAVGGRRSERQGGSWPYVRLRP